MNPFPNNQRLLDLLKSLDLNWPNNNRFAMIFNDDVNAGLQSESIRTVTLMIEEQNVNDEESPPWKATDLKLKNLFVGHA